MVDFPFVDRLLPASWRRHKYEPLHNQNGFGSKFVASTFTQKSAALIVVMLCGIAAIGLLVSG